MAGGTVDLLGTASPARAQLTIFYSGTVNVYNDIPADKAHAIMLLLGSNNNKRSAAEETTSVKEVAQVAQKAVPTPSSSFGRAPSNVVAPAASPRTEAMIPSVPQSPFSVSSGPQQQQAAIRKRSQAELPFARKASLARFLEKRKDRVVQTKPGPSEEEATGSMPKRLKGENEVPESHLG